MRYMRRLINITPLALSQTKKVLPSKRMSITLPGPPPMNIHTKVQNNTNMKPTKKRKCPMLALSEIVKVDITSMVRAIKLLKKAAIMLKITIMNILMRSTKLSMVMNKALCQIMTITIMKSQ